MLLPVELSTMPDCQLLIVSATLPHHVATVVMLVEEQYGHLIIIARNRKMKQQRVQQVMSL